MFGQALTCNAPIQVNRPPLPKLGSSWLAGAQRVNQPPKVSDSLLTLPCENA